MLLRSLSARLESLTSYDLLLVEFGEDFAGGAGAAGGYVVHACGGVFANGKVVGGDFFEQLFKRETAVVGVG